MGLDGDALLRLCHELVVPGVTIVRLLHRLAHDMPRAKFFMRRDALTQPQRFLAFVVNTSVFYFIYVWATGHWYVTGSGETLWLASAVAWWTLGLLSAPWYRPPRDALGVPQLRRSPRFTLDLSTAVSSSFELELARGVSIAYPR